MKKKLTYFGTPSRIQRFHDWLILKLIGNKQVMVNMNIVDDVIQCEPGMIIHNNNIVFDPKAK